MRQFSKPRLELQATLMAVRLKRQIIMEHKKEALVHISHRKQQVIKPIGCLRYCIQLMFHCGNV